MFNPLNDFRKIGDVNFIKDTEARFTEYDNYLTPMWDNVQASTKDGVMYVSYASGDFETSMGIKSSEIYIDECYDFLEFRVRHVIEKEVKTITTAEGRELYIKPILAELNLILGKVIDFDVDEKLKIYQHHIISKLQYLIQLFQASYMTNVAKTSPQTLHPKIQWLGKTNLLTTLIYELWKGQEKGKGQSTKPLIKADKKDLEFLLLNNFIDSKGQPLSSATISDYLNEYKTINRVKKGTRIEIDF